MKTNTIGTIVRQLRLSSGYTQKGLAKAVGCTGTHISQIENGYNTASPLILGLILKTAAVPAKGDFKRKIALPNLRKPKELQTNKTVEKKPNQVSVPLNKKVEIYGTKNQKVIISFE